MTDAAVTTPSRSTGRAPRLSAYGAAAALVALGTLFYVINGSVLLPIFAVALLGTYATDLRIPSTSSVRLIVRVSLYTLVYLVNQQQDDPRNTDYLVGPASFRALFGEIYAAEMVIQAWRRRADDAYAELAVVFFSGLVFITACNTFDDQVLWIVTPAYVALVALSLRGYRARVPALERAAASPPGSGRRRRGSPLGTAALRVALFLVPLALGLFAQQVVRQNRGYLNDLGNVNLRRRGAWLRGVGGMASQPELGSTFDLRGSPARVLRVTGLGEDDHLRGVAFHAYDSGRWGPPVNTRQLKPVPAALTIPRAQPGTPTLRGSTAVQFTRLSDDNPFLFVPLTAGSLEREDTGETEWAPDDGGPLRSRGRSLSRYQVTVGETPDFQGPFATPWPLTKDDRARHLQRPDGDTGERLARIARAATREATTPREKANAVVAYLISNHRYSLSTTVDPGVDPVVQFLEKKKDAHCEFFAASAALLLRYVDVPTRYVTGYLAHERTSSGDVVVRQRDAHAWTEVWIDGTGWIYIDATPGDGRPDGMPESVEPWRRWVEWFQDRFAAFQGSISDLPPWAINLILGTFAFLPVGYLALRAYLARRRTALGGAVGFVYSPPAPDLVTLARRFEAAVARAPGLTPFPPERTWEEHLEERLAGEEEAVGSETLLRDARAFARAYDVARFGGAEDPATRERLQALLEQIEKEVRKPTA